MSKNETTRRKQFDWAYVVFNAGTAFVLICWTLIVLSVFGVVHL